MKKRKNVIIPMMLAAAVAAASIPCSSQDVEASSNTYEVSVSKGYLALRSSMAYLPTREADKAPAMPHNPNIPMMWLSA